MKGYVNDLQLMTINVGYACHQGDWNWTNVRSPFARLYYVTGGEAWIVKYAVRNGEERVRIHLTPNHLYLIPPFCTHDEICTGEFNHYYIHVYENPDTTTLYFENYDFPIEVKAESIDLELFKKLTYANPFMKLPGSDPTSYDNASTLFNSVSMNLQRPLADIVMSRGILYILFSKFLRFATVHKSLDDDRISAAVSYIRHHLCDDLSVESLSNIACMSKDHFIRCFKKEMKETPVNYISRLRMEHAELLLITTNMSVKKIAESVGYMDSGYFIRVFRKFMGISPVKYRNRSK